MVIDPALTVKREVVRLVDLQIAALQQPSSLDSTQLQDFQARAEKLRNLYGELDRIGRAKRLFNLVRAS